MSAKRKPAAQLKAASKTNSRFHIDKRAAEVASSAGDDDELLSTKDLAEWLGVSVQWINLQRKTGEGPEFERLSPRIIRYRRGKARQWLQQRSHLRTNEYAKAAQR